MARDSARCVTRREPLVGGRVAPPCPIPPRHHPLSLGRAVPADQPDGSGEWASRLIPADDRELERLSNTTFIDAEAQFKLGAGDQALVAAALKYLHRTGPGREVLELTVPRGRHDVALGIATAIQLTQLERITSPIGALFSPWRGSIVVVGHNTGVQRRLGELRVRGIHMRGGVADALRAHRIRPDGCLARPDGTVVRHEGGPGRLLYLNTRTSWPELSTEKDPLVLIDATRIGNSDNVGRALEWADNHGARHVIVVTHLGDATAHFDLDKAARPCLTFDLSPATVADLLYELGSPTGDAYLSTNRLVAERPATLRVRTVRADTLSEALFMGLRAISAAPGSRETWPFAVGRAHRLLTAMRRLVVDLERYNKAAAIDPWLMSLASARRTVDREGDLRQVRSRLRNFAITHWGTARASALEAYDLVEVSNPKFDALLDEIDVALRQSGRTVLVRVADRAAVQALRGVLPEYLDEELLARVSVARVGEVCGWASPVDGRITEILPGAPPAWDVSWLFTGESGDRVVLAYPFEQRWIEKANDRQVQSLRRRRDAFFDRFQLGRAPRLEVAVDAPGLGPVPRLEHSSLTIDDLWERILEVDQPPPSTHTSDPCTVRHGPMTGEPQVTVTTDDGRAHLLPPTQEVEVFVSGKYRIRLAKELQVGDQMLYRLGTGRETLFTRLVAASHDASGVGELDLVMRRFRDACRRIRTSSGSWAEGNRRLAAAGANASTQLQSWATGETIAPADAADVLVVAELTNDQGLEKNWYRIEALAQELRSLHQRLGRVLSAAVSEAIDGGGPNVRKVIDLVGTDAAEILDEFGTATITTVTLP